MNYGEVLYNIYNPSIHGTFLADVLQSKQRRKHAPQEIKTPPITLDFQSDSNVLVSDI